ncbi:hypothetical protein LB503_006673 [Fusarium chuoi]|nr:hypothetical protein LB503_006673 [Fusarium chuoi]
MSFQPLVLTITSANLDVLIHLTSALWYRQPDAEVRPFVCWTQSCQQGKCASTSEKLNGKCKRGKSIRVEQLSLAFGVFLSVAQGIVFPRHW